MNASRIFYIDALKAIAIVLVVMGHTNVRTTQRYTKVVDEKKENAADAIKIDLAAIK